MEKKDTLERIKTPDTKPIYTDADYDDGNIPKVDLPEDSDKNSVSNSTQDIIPDEVPRKDGPGGEGN